MGRDGLRWAWGLDVRDGPRWAWGLDVRDGLRWTEMGLKMSLGPSLEIGWDHL